jgi:D-alanyl-D-alanine carboxypeptidase
MLAGRLQIGWITQKVAGSRPASSIAKRSSARVTQGAGGASGGAGRFTQLRSGCVTMSTVTIRHVFSLCCLAAALAPGLACGGDDETSKDIESVAAVVGRMAADNQFSGAVLIAKNGRPIFRQAYGLADRDRRVPTTVETRFRIGSMNKMFTAVAIMQLVEAGKVELSAPLGDYLADYRNKDVATEVTIRHLLTHTGGTGDIFGPDFDAHRDELRTLSDYVDLYGKRGLEFEPGSRWAYSNYGFILLGAVIEQVTGKSYYDYVRTHIFEPAGMTRTGSLPEDQAVPGRAVGYMKPPGTAKWVPNTDTLPYRGTSAGGGYSTVVDLARFADALLSHKLLSRENTARLITGKVEAFAGEKYAYGFEDRRDKRGNGSVGHGGGAPGMNGDLRIYPKSGYVVAALANMDPPAAQRVTEWVCAFVLSPLC